MSFRFDVVESSFMLLSNLPFQVIEHKPPDCVMLSTRPDSSIGKFCLCGAREIMPGRTIRSSGPSIGHVALDRFLPLVAE